MKNSLFILIFISPAKILLAQNIGIGISSPAEKLDIAGNIKISGELKPGGVSGVQGQVLTNAGNGTMSWANISDFKNRASFLDTSTQNISWTVPAGVTKVWIEAWGGGGAGMQAGGGGGAYVSIQFNVVAGNQFQFTVGKGGRDMPQEIAAETVVNQNGTGSQVNFNGQFYTAGGGTGAEAGVALGASRFSPGYGGRLSSSVSFAASPMGAFYYQAGNPGGIPNYDFIYAGSTLVQRKEFYGFGGSAANTSYDNATGGSSLYLYTGTPVLAQFCQGRSGIFPGGGGAGSLLQNDGRAGANGMIIVHY